MQFSSVESYLDHVDANAEHRRKRRGESSAVSVWFLMFHEKEMGLNTPT